MYARLILTFLALAALAMAACHGEVAAPAPVVRESAVRVLFDPPFEAFPAEVIGPDTVRLNALESREDHCWAWVSCLPKVGQATFGSLRSGAYVVRLGAVDRTRLYVVLDSGAVSVGRGDTATVTPVVAPASGILTIGDTVAGTASSVPAATVSCSARGTVWILA